MNTKDTFILTPPKTYMRVCYPMLKTHEMENQMTFLKSLTVSDFKARNNGNGIEIIKSPKTGKLFFVCGSTKGPVSAGYETKPTVSLCEGTDGVEFWLLHKGSSTNVIDTL